MAKSLLTASDKIAAKQYAAERQKTDPGYKAKSAYRLIQRHKTSAAQKRTASAKTIVKFETIAKQAKGKTKQAVKQLVSYEKHKSQVVKDKKSPKRVRKVGGIAVDEWTRRNETDETSPEIVPGYIYYYQDDVPAGYFVVRGYEDREYEERNDGLEACYDLLEAEYDTTQSNGEEAKGLVVLLTLQWHETETRQVARQVGKRGEKSFVDETYKAGYRLLLDVAFPGTE